MGWPLIYYGDRVPEQQKILRDLLAATLHFHFATVHAFTKIWGSLSTPYFTSFGKLYYGTMSEHKDYIHTLEAADYIPR